MKAPPYPLQAAVDQREALKEVAKRELAAALQAAEREAQVLREHRETHSALVRDREDHARHLYDPDEQGMLPIPLIEKRTDGLRFLDGRVKEAFRSIEQQRQVLDRAERAVESCRVALVEADRELKVVEKHYENWLADWKREATRRDQRQSEEITLARYAREDRGSE